MRYFCLEPIEGQYGLSLWLNLDEVAYFVADDDEQSITVTLRGNQTPIKNNFSQLKSYTITRDEIMRLLRLP